MVVSISYQNTNASKNDDEFVFEELIMNALNGKYYKYCSGWDLEAFICKNGQANCCWGNFIHIPIDGGFIEGNCTDFEFEASKDEINIKLTPFKEVEVKKQSFGKILSTNTLYIFLNSRNKLSMQIFVQKVWKFKVLVDHNYWLLNIDFLT